MRGDVWFAVNDLNNDGQTDDVLVWTKQEVVWFKVASDGKANLRDTLRLPNGF